MRAKQTKIFGMNVAIDPKLIVLVLLVIAGIVYYFTSGSETPGGGSSQASANTAASRTVVNSPVMGRPTQARRATAVPNDRGTLKLIPVNGTNGDIDPTLRLALLDRLKSIPPAPGSRNLFEAGGPVAVAQATPPPVHPPILKPGPVIPAGPPPPPPPTPFAIPLKYYGFVKPSGRALDGNRGFFMDGDNILIGAEGDVLEKKFLIVALTPNTARLEDTQAKQGQDLQVTPEAPPAQ